MALGSLTPQEWTPKDGPGATQRLVRLKLRVQNLPKTDHRHIEHMEWAGIPAGSQLTLLRCDPKHRLMQLRRKAWLVGWRQRPDLKGLGEWLAPTQDGMSQQEEIDKQPWSPTSKDKVAPQLHWGSELQTVSQRSAPSESDGPHSSHHWSRTLWSHLCIGFLRPLWNQTDRPQSAWWLCEGGVLGPE